MTGEATLFEQDGPTRFVPTDWCRGPWDPNALHAGASGALLTQLVDQSASLVPMRTVRLSFDILRPVPLAPLDVILDVEREGKRLQFVRAVLSADGVDVTRLRALRMRRGDLELEPNAPTPASLDDLDMPAPTEVADEPFPELGEHGRVFAHAMQLRPVHGGLLTAEAGPGACWFRLRHPVIDDQAATPTARAVAAADFGNGIGSPVSFRDWIYVNADLQVMLQREPAGEWVGISASSIPNGDGTALTTTRLVDKSGEVGMATQSLFLEQRTQSLDVDLDR